MNSECEVNNTNHIVHTGDHSIGDAREILSIINVLLNAPTSEADLAILRMLTRLGKVASFDCVQVWVLQDADKLKLTHVWPADDFVQGSACTSYVQLDALGAWWSDLTTGNVVQISDAYDKAKHFSAFSCMWMQDARSLILVPMMSDSGFSGLLVLRSTYKPRHFQRDEVDMLQIVTNCIRIVLERAAANLDIQAKEVALAVQHDRLQATLSAVPDLVLEFDTTGCIIGCFAGADFDEALLPSDLIGYPPEKVFPKVLATFTRDTMQRVDQDRTVIEREFSLTLDNKERRYRVIASPRSNQNDLAGYICVVRDITERIVERRRLRRLSRVAELTSNLVIVMDTKQKAKWVNPAFEKRTGWTLDDIREHCPTKFLGLEKAEPETLERIQKAIETGQASQLEVRRLSRFGQDFWVNIEIQPLFLDSGEIDGFISVQTDITSLKRSHKQALKERALALDASTDGIAFSNANGNYTYMNAAHRKLFGISADEDIRNLNWRELCQPEELARIMTEVMPRLQASGHWKGEILGLHRNGSTIFQEVSLTLHDHGLMCITRDISDRVKLEEERTQLRERLQVAQRRETIAFLASGVAHDLNNLVAVINGSVSLLEQDATLGEKEELGLGRILRATTAITDLVSGLSSLARSEKSRSILDLRRVVHDGLGLIGSAHIHGHHVTMDLPETFCPVWANSTELLQVIVNLLLNACDATGDRVNQIRVSVFPGVDLPVRNPDAGGVLNDTKYVLFSVSDTGIGMDTETLQRVFDTYYSTKAEAGHGLGLPIIVNILRENAAALWVNSAPTVGTTITVAWPSHPIECKPHCETRLQHNCAVDLNGHNILVVDDLPDVAEVFCDILESAGATAVAITDPLEAQSLLLENSAVWSVLVTDLDMPEAGGTTLAKVAMNCRPSIPTILITAMNPKLDNGKDLFHSILIKPVEKYQLISAVYAAANSDHMIAL